MYKGTKGRAARLLRRMQLQLAIRKAKRAAEDTGEWQAVFVCKRPEDGFAFADDRTLASNPAYIPGSKIGEMRAWRFDSLPYAGRAEYRRKHEMPAISREMARKAVQSGIFPEEAARGYGLFCSEEMGGAIRVERAGTAFESNAAAILQARIDGLAIILDFPLGSGQEEYAGFIDTPENRGILSGFLKENYGISWQ